MSRKRVAGERKGEGGRRRRKGEEGERGRRTEREEAGKQGGRKGGQRGTGGELFLSFSTS